MMQLTCAVVLLLCVTVEQLQMFTRAADIGCIPGRCDPAAVNRKRDVSGRAAPTEPVTSDVPKTKNQTLKDFLQQFERRRNKTADVIRVNGGAGIANEYMVILFNKDTSGPDSFAEKYKSHIRPNGTVPLYDTDVYFVRADAKALELMCAEKAVAYIEQNQRKHLAANCGNQRVRTAGGTVTVSWGLSRIDQQDVQWDDFYKFDQTAAQSDVNVYVIDTGVKPNAVEYGSRLTGLIDTTTGSVSPNPLDDANGHGTHVAGTVGSATYGVAKQVKVFAVRISSDLAGTATETAIISAYQAVIDHVNTNQKSNKAVINISFGGPASKTENMKVKETVEAGITFVTAAGNECEDACCSSPASATDAITVGCTAPDNSFCSFSNWGCCVDINAPGAAIGSLFRNGNRFELSGTSMAAPHVAGVAAIMIARALPTGLTPAQVKTKLIATASNNLTTNVKHPSITTSKLLYFNCEA